ncbi:hypothetical protein DL768_000265 [Monosporascus sp. mg162]|nr:hypothetical protein DL768_000265 [Monosporascus sp. mg162]
MTSVRRDESNVYRFDCIDVPMPKYNILSYTWGRWRVDGADCPALPVIGTPWKIPAVEASHFSVDAFQKVLHKVTADPDVEWAWVDVGCIDQRNNGETAQEIGRQASIFKQAQKPFVWLSHLCNADLSSAVHDMQIYGLKLRDFIDQPSPKLDLEHIACKLHKALKFIFSDPWFSSLWTLQEVVLRNDAVVLSAEGEPVVWDYEPRLQYMFLTLFINFCQNVYQDLEMVERPLSLSSLPVDRSKVAETIRGMKEIILHAGFYYLFSRNPNVQYGTARYRKTSNDVDRIYAIMQIYNIQVGKSLRPDENPTLEKLLDEFAGAINHQSAILGQFFLHTDAPDRGKSWRITEKSTVPDPLMEYQQPNDCCTIALNINQDDNAAGAAVVHASGKCCQFSDLLKIATEAGMREGPMFNNGWGLNLEILFDHHVQGSITNNFPHDMPRIPSMRVLGTTPDSARIEQENIWVLLLGDIKGPYYARLNIFCRKNIGLLIHRTDWENENKDWTHSAHKRLGVCMWTAYEAWEHRMLERILWHDVVDLELQ